MERTEHSMSNKNLNHVAAIEKAIAEKYGAEAVSNPKANWNEEREKEYLDQMQELYLKQKKNDRFKNENKQTKTND